MNKSDAKLFLAAQNGKLKKINSLLKGGFFSKPANLNAIDLNGYTVLHYAAMSNSLETINFLLDSKIDINQKNMLGETPIFNAVRTNNLKVIKLLIKKGAEVNLCNDKGETVLSEYTHYNEDVAIAELLIKAGAELKEAKKGSKTPLDIAFNKNKQKLITLYKQHLPAKYAMDMKYLTIREIITLNFLLTDNQHILPSLDGKSVKDEFVLSRRLEKAGNIAFEKSDPRAFAWWMQAMINSCNNYAPYLYTSFAAGVLGFDKLALQLKNASDILSMADYEIVEGCQYKFLRMIDDRPGELRTALQIFADQIVEYLPSPKFFPKNDADRLNFQFMKTDVILKARSKLLRR